MGWLSCTRQNQTQTSFKIMSKLKDEWVVHHKNRSVISIAETDLNEMDLSCGIFGEGPAVCCVEMPLLERPVRLAGRKKSMMLLQRWRFVFFAKNHETSVFKKLLHWACHGLVVFWNKLKLLHFFRSSSQQPDLQAIDVSDAFACVEYLDFSPNDPVGNLSQNLGPWAFDHQSNQ